MLEISRKSINRQFWKQDSWEKN